MSDREFFMWSVYRDENGPIVPWQRADWHAAQLAAATLRSDSPIAEHLIRFRSDRPQAESEMLGVISSLGGGRVLCRVRVGRDGKVIRKG